MRIQTDIVIIGSGISALQSAKILAKRFNIHIITKSDIRNGSSYKAQGGIAAVTSRDDRTEYHVKDTLFAGEYHHSEENVRILVEEGKHTIQQLIQEMLKRCIIQNNNSPFASPVDLMGKKDGTWRLCVNYKELIGKLLKTN